MIAMADNQIDPTKSVALQCSFCGGVHEGVPALEKSLAELDPDAAVFFDRDVVEPGLVANLCGPRFRLTNRTLLAHFGSPAGACYVVFRFDAMYKKWTVMIDTGAKNRRRVLVAGTDFPSSMTHFGALPIGTRICSRCEQIDPKHTAACDAREAENR